MMHFVRTQDAQIQSLKVNRSNNLTAQKKDCEIYFHDCLFTHDRNKLDVQIQIRVIYGKQWCMKTFCA